MQIYQGKSVFSGIAIGKIRVYKKNERQVKRVKVENPDAEMARFEEAKAKGIAQLGVLYEKACKEVGEANAAIFEVHQMMMEDDGARAFYRLKAELEEAVEEAERGDYVVFDPVAFEPRAFRK